MSHWLDDAIARTAGPLHRFLTELRSMLDHVRPAELDEQSSEAKVEPGRVELRLAHAREESWSIWVDAGEDSIVVGAAEMHEHFEPWRDDEERSWTTQAVDMIAELLRGQIEIHTTYRGGSVARVRHYLVDEDGGRREFGLTAFSAQLAFWRPKRTEVERVSFGAQR